MRALVAALKERGEGNPRIHPNGFIQLDLEPVEDSWDASKKRGHSGATRRLHIWNPPMVTLPRQKTVNEIHDHVFDMHSLVLKGTLFQHMYYFTVGLAEDPTHEIYRAVYDKASSSRLAPTGIKGLLRHATHFPVHAGSDYTQPAFTLHNSEAPLGTVVTLMTKERVHEGDATVICPIDSPPDNDFDRASAAPAEDLWLAIEQSLR
jgi:hypothetical protein